MSKYELRSGEIKQSAKKQNWNICWRRQGSRIYVRVDTRKGHPFLGGHNEVYSWLLRWYKNPELTSGGYGCWTFMVCDLLMVLRGHS